MSFKDYYVATAALLVYLAIFSSVAYPAIGTDTQHTAPAEAISQLNKTTLERKIESAETDTDLSKEDISKLVSLYRKTISNLETALVNDQAADAFIQMSQDAPIKAAALRKKTVEKKKLVPEDSLEITSTTPIEELEQHLLKERADLAAVEANLQKIHESIKYQAGRPQAIRQQLIDTKKQVSGISDELNPPVAEGDNQLLKEAEYWLRESHARMLVSQIRMLDQELLSQPARLDLLTAEEEKAEHSVQFVKARAEKLKQHTDDSRQFQARLTKSKADSAKALAEGTHPLVEELANSNADLSAQISDLILNIKKVELEEDRISAEGKRISDDFKSAKQKLEVAGLSQIIGQVLQEQRRVLPDTETYRRKSSEIETQIAEVSLHQIQHKEELKELHKVDQFIADYTAGITGSEKQRIEDELRYLTNDRKQFLEQAYKTEDTYLRALIELDFAQRSIREATEQYDIFLAERLLWIRSARPINISSIYMLPGQLQELLALEHWRNILTTLYKQATNNPWMVFTLIIVTILLWKDRSMCKKLIATGNYVGNVMRDNISFTVRGLLLTLLLASVWPLLMASIGWQLLSALESSSFTKNVGHGLLLTSQALFFLRAYRILCMKGGIAERHFKWPESCLRLLRHDIDIFIYTFLPPGFIALIVINSGIPGHAESLGRLAFIIASLALTVFFYRVLNPATGALREFSLRQKKPAMAGIRYLWLLIAIVIPIGSAILALLGFLYSASTLLGNLIQSLWLILELAILHQFVVRWLLIARRRLVLQAACEEQDSMRAMREKSTVVAREDTLDIEKPNIDINALSDDIYKLLNASLVILAVIMLWASWSDILPAFHIFDQVTLWQHTVEVAGEVRFIPITLTDAALAVITIIILLIFVKRLPALIEILLRQRSTIKPGSLYATKLLISYGVVAVGVVLIFSTLGGTWSEIQWVFAALGIGIGFGLQEVVANFISGLVILFERPIRVGDVVTVGDVNGVVTRIRIRATTIKDFDHKELLVPNKEFINSQLLNWSLSDNLIRLMITVGIDYGSDIKLATKLMEEAARESKFTIDEPAPFVTFESFDDNSLKLVLRYFIDNIDYRLLSIGDLHEAINEKFNSAGISVSFPQRDVHINTTQPLDLRIQHEKQIKTPVDYSDKALCV